MTSRAQCCPLMVDLQGGQYALQVVVAPHPVDEVHLPKNSAWGLAGEILWLTFRFTPGRGPDHFVSRTEAADLATAERRGRRKRVEQARALAPGWRPRRYTTSRNLWRLPI
jgi:hypothetical protein